jgi:uncharacterized protein (DUF4415 family)
LERLSAEHIKGLLFTTSRQFNSALVARRAAGVAPMSVKIDGDVHGQSRECGETTQYRIFATLRAALNAAVKARKISWNPCDGVQDLAAPEAAERQRWTPAQAAQFIAATTEDVRKRQIRAGRPLQPQPHVQVVNSEHAVAAIIDSVPRPRSWPTTSSTGPPNRSIPSNRTRSAAGSGLCDQRAKASCRHS